MRTLYIKIPMDEYMERCYEKYGIKKLLKMVQDCGDLEENDVIAQVIKEDR